MEKSILLGLLQLLFLWATCSQLFRSEVKLEEEIKGVPPFSFPFFLQRAALCATLHAATAAMSIWHTFTEYTSAIISC